MVPGKLHTPAHPSANTEGTAPCCPQDRRQPRAMFPPCAVPSHRALSLHLAVTRPPSPQARCVTVSFLECASCFDPVAFSQVLLCPITSSLSLCLASSCCSSEPIPALLVPCQPRDPSGVTETLQGVHQSSFTFSLSDAWKRHCPSILTVK